MGIIVWSILGWLSLCSVAAMWLLVREARAEAGRVRAQAAHPLHGTTRIPMRRAGGAA